MRRKYNKNFYNKFKKINGMVREKVRPNPFGTLEEKGIIGKLVSSIGNKIIKKPLHNMNMKIVGKYYYPKIDSPVKGSIFYTIFNYVSYVIASIVVTFLISLLFKFFKF